MSGITGIHLKTQQTAAGKNYEVARLWIGGMYFSADLGSRESLIRRIATELGVEITDSRKPSESQ